MDNLTAHKRPQIQRMIEAVDAIVVYLPPYSPDFNPIEMIWSKVKRLLRSIGARTVDALHQAFGVAFAAVTPGDIWGCFQHCEQRRAALAAGAYVGEVVRRNTPKPEEWHWISYKQAAAMFPSVAKFPMTAATVGGLCSRHPTRCVTFPGNKVQKFLEDGPDDSVYHYTKVLIAWPPPKPNRKMEPKS